MKGYKELDLDMRNMGIQYKVGETYEIPESPKCYLRGYSFFKNISNIYDYPINPEDIRIFEVAVLGEIDTEDKKQYYTNKIKIIREVKKNKRCNIDETSAGYCNTNKFNTGHHNAGAYNTGNRNTGNANAGNRNTGLRNSGDRNSGYENSGWWNTGIRNSGDRNSGCCNTGNCNTGNKNRGFRNTGDYNTGEYNTGNWNTGNWNTGMFNTSKNPTIKLFDKESNWTIRDWQRSRANHILSTCPWSQSMFVDEKDMSAKEKEKHPEYKTFGGYVKEVIVTKKVKQKWWDNLPESDKQECYNLPNFDEAIFCECLGIEHI